MGPWAVPLLVVASLLLTGRYVGEERILAARAGARPARPRRQGHLVAPPCRGARLAARARPALAARSARARGLTSATRTLPTPGAPPNVAYARLLFAATLAAVAVAAPAAQAHVTLNPRTATANAFGRVDVRVPNERDDASTKSLVVYFPSGFYSASYKRVWGWTAKVSMRKLATPIPSADGDITEEVAKITWKRDDASRTGSRPGSFEEFGLSMRIPNKPGSTLYFPARQTYSGGEVVNWAAPPARRRPRRRVNVVAAP